MRSQQLHNLLLGEAFQQSDPACAPFLALLLLLQNGCKVPHVHAHPMLGTMYFPTGQGVVGLFWSGDVHRAAPWEAA